MKHVTAYLAIALVLWLPETAKGYTHTFVNQYNKPVRIEMSKRCATPPGYIIVQPGESGKLEAKCKDQDIVLSYTHDGIKLSPTLKINVRIAQITKKKDSPTWNLVPTRRWFIKKLPYIDQANELLLDLETAPNSGWTLEINKYDIEPL